MIQDLNTNGFYTTFTLNGKSYKLRTFNLKEDLLESELPGMLSIKELKLFNNGDYPSYIKEFLLKKVSLYDSSSEVNSFIYKDKEYWFDKNTRASLVNLANFTTGEFIFILGDEEVKIPVEKAKEFLAKLELYAQKCFINTNNHIKTIYSIATPKNKEEVKTYLDSIINYDYTTGYPDKIVLE